MPPNTLIASAEYPAGPDTSTWSPRCRSACARARIASTLFDRASALSDTTSGVATRADVPARHPEQGVGELHQALRADRRVVGEPRPVAPRLDRDPVERDGRAVLGPEGDEVGPVELDDPVGEPRPAAEEPHHQPEVRAHADGP